MTDLLLLGASGLAGNAAYPFLARSDVFDTVWLASRNKERADYAVEKSGIPNAKPIAVDITESASLDAAFAKVDLVANAAEHPVAAVEAAIRTGINYVDCLGHPSDLFALEAMEVAIREAGISVVIGAGAFPGVLEIFAAQAADALDHAEFVEMFFAPNLLDWGEPEQIIALADKGWEGTGGIQSLVHSSGAPLWMIEDCKRVQHPPGHGRSEKQTPGGTILLTQHVNNIEPLTLQRARPGVPGSAMSTCMWPRSAQQIWSEMAPKVVAGACGHNDLIKAIWSAAADGEHGPPPEVPIWAEASGEKDGKPAKATVWSQDQWASLDGMYPTTGGMLVYSAIALAKGDVDRKGLSVPVELFDPQSVYAYCSGERECDVELRIDWL